MEKNEGSLTFSELEQFEENEKTFDAEIRKKISEYFAENYNQLRNTDEVTRDVDASIRTDYTEIMLDFTKETIVTRSMVAAVVKSKAFQDAFAQAYRKAYDTTYTLDNPLWRKHLNQCLKIKEIAEIVNEQIKNEGGDLNDKKAYKKRASEIEAKAHEENNLAFNLFIPSELVRVKQRNKRVRWTKSVWDDFAMYAEIMNQR